MYRRSGLVFSFATLDTGPTTPLIKLSDSKSMSLKKLSDTKVYEPHERARRRDDLNLRASVPRNRLLYPGLFWPPRLPQVHLGSTSPQSGIKSSFPGP